MLLLINSLSVYITDLYTCDPMFQRNSSSQTGQNQGRGYELSTGSVTSNTRSAETQITLVLHAFIEPAHWGREQETLRVQVRCDLSWESNNAEVQCRK